MVTSWVLVGVCTPRPLAPVRSRQPTPRPPRKWFPEKEQTLGNGRFCCFCGFPSFRPFGKSRKSKGPRKWLPDRSEHCDMDDFAVFVGFPSFRPFGGRKSRKSKGPRGNGFRERSEHCEMDDFAAFVGFHSLRQLSAAENQKIQRGPGNGFRKRSEHWEMNDFAAFAGFPSFRQLSAAGNPENPRGPGNGFREKERTLRNGRFCCFPFISAAFGGGNPKNPRGPWKWLPEKERTLGNERFCCFCGVPLISALRRREIKKIQGATRKWLPGKFAAFVGFHSFRQLSAAGNPKNSRGPGNGFRKRSEHWKWTILLLLRGSPHFGSFRRPEIQKIQGVLEMVSGKGANIDEMDDFAAFVGFPTFRPFGGRKSRESKRVCDFAAFVGFRFISAAFGGRKSRKSQEPWKWLPGKERTFPEVISRAPWIFWVSGRRPPVTWICRRGP